MELLRRTDALRWLGALGLVFALSACSLATDFDRFFPRDGADAGVDGEVPLDADVGMDGDIGVDGEVIVDGGPDACDPACADGETCEEGVCLCQGGDACGSGEVCCEDIGCRALGTDDDCAACGNACSETQACCDGECRSVNSVVRCLDCETSCDAPNTAAACTAGGCELTCVPGFDNCDEDLAGTGCETALDSSDHCGACGVACDSDEVCTGGSCAGDCAPGETDCGGGTCVDTTSNPAHCNGCDMPCVPPANATSTCAGSECGFACRADFEDCDGDPANGCELLIGEDCYCEDGAAEGGRICVANESVCDYPSEICNRQDDDCDGFTDQGIFEQRVLGTLDLGPTASGTLYDADRKVYLVRRRAGTIERVNFDSRSGDVLNRGFLTGLGFTEPITPIATGNATAMLVVAPAADRLWFVAVDPDGTAVEAGATASLSIPGANDIQDLRAVMVTDPSAEPRALVVWREQGSGDAYRIEVRFGPNSVELLAQWGVDSSVRAIDVVRRRTGEADIAYTTDSRLHIRRWTPSASPTETFNRSFTNMDLAFTPTHLSLAYDRSSDRTGVLLSHDATSRAQAFAVQGNSIEGDLNLGTPLYARIAAANDRTFGILTQPASGADVRFSRHNTRFTREIEAFSSNPVFYRLFFGARVGAARYFALSPSEERLVYTCQP